MRADMKFATFPHVRWAGFSGFVFGIFIGRCKLTSPLIGGMSAETFLLQRLPTCFTFWA
jgi:hypothetical protein